MGNGQGKSRRAVKYDLPAGPIILFAVLIVAVVAAVAVFSLGRGKKVLKNVTLEAGDRIELAMFLRDPGDLSAASFRSDVWTLDTSVPGEHNVVITVDGRNYASTLTVRDTVAPYGEPVTVSVTQGNMPDPAQCVKNIVDVTGVTVSFQEEPDVSTRGQHAAVVLLTDAGGNSTAIICMVNVYADSVPPVIRGFHDMTAYIGDEVDFRGGVTVTDSVDTEPTLDVDLSQVNFQIAGTYQVTYRARDKAGNTSEATVSLVLREHRTNDVAETVVISLARDVLARFTNSRMDQMDVAYAIYRWVRNNINYVSSDEVSTWTGAAYDVFQTRSGDDFGFFAVTKALLKAAGIESHDIVTSKTAPSVHYWNLVNVGSGWYHMDPFPRTGGGDDFFMLTDSELEFYSEAHNGSHLYDGIDYPARAVESVQDMVDYASPTLNREPPEDEGEGDTGGADDTGGAAQ